MRTRRRRLPDLHLPVAPAGNHPVGAGQAGADQGAAAVVEGARNGSGEKGHERDRARDSGANALGVRISRAKQASRAPSGEASAAGS